MASTTSFKFAGCQLDVGSDKEANLQGAERAVEEAVARGAQVVCLPECFNCPYSNDAFPVYAENFEGLAVGNSDTKSSKSAAALSAWASKHKIYLIGGSIPEVDASGALYNTSLTFGPDGTLLAKHRKVHLFDIDVPGRIVFKESDTLSPGASFTSFPTPYGNFGIGICYDVRFPEYAHVLAHEKDCVFICYPGAFNTTTGPMHWELLLRARASDNQVFVAGVSPARSPTSKYQAWGHTTVVDPWAKVIATTEETADIVVADVDVNSATDVRNSIPIRKQKATHLYNSASSRK